MSGCTPSTRTLTNRYSSSPRRSNRAPLQLLPLHYDMFTGELITSTQTRVDSSSLASPYDLQHTRSTLSIWVTRFPGTSLPSRVRAVARVDSPLQLVPLHQLFQVALCTMHPCFLSRPMSSTSLRFQLLSTPLNISCSFILSRPVAVPFRIASTIFCITVWTTWYTRFVARFTRRVSSSLDGSPFIPTHPPPLSFDRLPWLTSVRHSLII